MAQSSATFTPGFSALFDLSIRRATSGLSPFDRRHKFVASVVYNTNFQGFGDTAKAILNNGRCTNRQRIQASASLR